MKVTIEMVAAPVAPSPAPATFVNVALTACAARNERGGMKVDTYAGPRPAM